MSVFLDVSDVSKMDAVAEGAVGIANLEFGGRCGFAYSGPALSAGSRASPS